MQMDPPLQGYAKRFFNLYSRMLNMLITAPTGSISVFPTNREFSTLLTMVANHQVGWTSKNCRENMAEDMFKGTL